VTTSCRIVSTLLLAACLPGCKREHRVFDPGASGATPASGTVLSEVSAGQRPLQAAPLGYQQSAYTVAEGKRLYQAYNCVGCHAQGGGAIGPALMDSEWIYGSSLEQIHSTIVQGRPNGMPTFAGKIPDFQVWEIAAYVRSMSGLLPSDVAPSRSDHMPASVPESAKEEEHPAQENPQPVKGPKP
jgi:cytochrome c oxidase cbb3-type subunit III